ncbi:MAG TPA: CHAD domain-containing protein [Nitrososphaeraceae archaeon]|nr:CHAD domain-containing protein [Nitrososphaeraceae archaeon]
MLTLLPFLIKLHQSIERLNHRTNAYIKNSNEKNIHDVRTSVRRFNSTFLSLPKKYRTGPMLLSEYNQIANKFFKINSKIRDYDIIFDILNNYPQNSQRDLVIDSIKKDRQSNLEKAKTIAISLKDLGANEVVDKMNITERELQKRYNKVLSNLISKIELNLPIVITNAKKIEELHQLRKDCKKMRYMLELLPEENRDAIELKKIFEKIQDHLGSIHDFDITINYLQSLQPNKEIQEMINTETEKRRLKYEEFLNFSKRRLQLTRDSFLIRIKILK